MTRRRKSWLIRHTKSLVLFLISVGLFIVGLSVLWVGTLKMPDLSSFENRRTIESTKIYDRTGEILLYDTGRDIKRTSVSLSDISPYIQKASIAIEDEDFYSHAGIKPTSILRAVLTNLTSGKSHGGSTITQQVVKNSLLTKDKTFTRKIKEWVIAVKLEGVMDKDSILETYLNENPYGGTIYGVEEASRAFFGRSAIDVTLAQAAYLAAIPQAPTYYSPYGTRRDALDARQKLVLQKMYEQHLINKVEFDESSNEIVQFMNRNETSLRAPHFVMFVLDQITNKYGENAILNDGLKVITTLDYELQKEAEDIIKRFSPTLEETFGANNIAMTALDPKSGDILVMVGSRNYFDEVIDGNFNVTTARRQPGSTFKPFVYATAFNKGYTPDTILFDVRTEFSTRCNVDGKPKNPNDDPEKICYSPDEYDGIFEGPMTIKQALAKSRNIPAVKALYLAGIKESIKTATDMGISGLTDPNRYGLTLVLGGGEVSLLDLTSAYGVFANDGVRNPYRSILRVEDARGIAMEDNSYIDRSARVIGSETVRQITDILSDTSIRMNSLRPIGESVGRQVAIKTGTTNDYKDVWTLGYTPNLVVGAWAGRNDNTPMKHDTAGLIISPVWGAFMSQAVKKFPTESFSPPPPVITTNKPVLHGVWQGGLSYWKDKISGKVATEYTPPETLEEVVIPSVHTILHWLNKDDPNGEPPQNPSSDSQYEYWEYGVRKWFESYKISNPSFVEVGGVVIPTETDDVHLPDKQPVVTFVSPLTESVLKPQDPLLIKLKVVGPYPPLKTDVYLNDKYILTTNKDPLNISFIPNDVGGLLVDNQISVVFYDSVYNRTQASINFSGNISEF